MNQNPGRHRRKSTLGRKFLPGDKPPPVFVVPANPPIGIGRARSAKKTPLCKASKDYIARKRLFLKSPTDITSFITQQEQPRRGNDNSFGSNVGSNSSLNLTGIRSISTPSPDSKASSNVESIHNPFLSEASTTTISSSTNTAPPLDLHSRISAASYQNTHVYTKLEPPKSPGPSKYSQFMMREFANLKPPEDPGDNVNFKKFLLENTNKVETEITNSQISSYHKNVSPKLSIPKVIVKQSSSPNFSEISNSNEKKTEHNKKLNTIQEDLDSSTESFLWAEQTIMDKNETITDSFIVPDVNVKYSSKNTVQSSKVCEQNFIPTSDSEVKLLLLSAVEDINQGLSSVHEGMAYLKKTAIQMTSLRRKVLRLLVKYDQPKNGVKKINKENMPLNIPKTVENKWLENLKSSNPGLLRTPNLSRARSSIANQSAILTPHSLSSMVHDQMEDLFDDEY